jgi:ATP-dependent RNA helicase DeaD
VHRIGRTGRAGRKGEAILFVAPKERRLLRAIEKATSQSIEQMHMPSTSDINDKRVAKFKQRIVDTLAAEDWSIFQEILEDVRQENDLDPMHIASALAVLAQGQDPLLIKDQPGGKKERHKKRDRQEDYGNNRSKNTTRPKKPEFSPEPLPLKEFPDLEMERFIINAGYNHDIKPGNIVGAIANEADIESCYIGSIEIHDDFSTVDLPEGMPKEVMSILQKARVAGRKMELRPITQNSAPGKNIKRSRKHHRGSKKK